MLAQKDTFTILLNTYVCVYMIYTYVYIPNQQEDASQTSIFETGSTL